ncbi:MAG: EcsC family protein [Cyanobacteriota bacterium]|nr:EcsC family protein [Cyanobacteriota bacterium]
MAPEPEAATWPRQLARTVVRWGIDGAPLPGAWVGGPGLRLRSALELAHGVRFRAERVGLEAAIAELIEEQARWNAGSGFVTGVGGFAFLPVQLPLALTATWVIQTRLVATIAALYNLDLEHEAVRTRILLTLLGEEAGVAVKQLGVKAGQRFAEDQLRRLVLRRAGGQGLGQLNRAIPLLGGLVGGSIDYLLTRQLGHYAAASLRRQQPAPATDTVIDVEILG